MTDNEADLISIASGYLPEGYVIVPVEPTEAMSDKAYELMLNPDVFAEDIYKAMIQAAQEEE